MHIMGLDVSSTSTGVVVFDYDGASAPVGKAVEALPLAPKSGLDVIDRATFMMERLHKIATTYTPAIIMIEDYGFASQKLAPQAETKGVLLFMLRALGLDWNLVAPQRLKKFAGASTKEETRLAVFKRWGFEHKSNDVVDAYVLAQIGLYLAADPLHRAGLPKFQTEVLSALEK